MQIILNDSSLKGQFSNISQFCDSTSYYILPCLIFCEKQEYEVLKSYDTFNCKITKQFTFHDILTKSNGYPELQLLKSKLVQLFMDQPYWNDEIKTPSEITADCKTEAFFRKGILLSYKGSDADGAKLYISINNREEVVSNASEKRQLLENLNEYKVYELTNSFTIPYSNLKVEVRSAEDHHNEPHFHISNSTGTDIVIYFKDFKQHKGKNPIPSDDKIIKEWLSNTKNKDYLIELWNYYHPEQQINGYHVNLK